MYKWGMVLNIAFDITHLVVIYQADVQLQSQQVLDLEIQQENEK